MLERLGTQLGSLPEIHALLTFQQFNRVAQALLITRTHETGAHFILVACIESHCGKGIFLMHGR